MAISECCGHILVFVVKVYVNVHMELGISAEWSEWMLFFFFFQISDLFFSIIYKKSGWWKIVSWPAVACLFPSFSQGYHLQTTRDLRPHPGVSLDPVTSYNPPQYRSRNQSYMRAVSTLSQASCLSQVSVSRFSYIHTFLNVDLDNLETFFFLLLAKNHNQNDNKSAMH